MSRTKLVFLIAFLILFTFSCDWIFKPGPCDASGPIVVYKTKNDYSNNLIIQLTKNKVTAYPGKQDVINQKPIPLANGYLLKRMLGDVVLSLTIDEYANSSKDYSHEDFMNLIIDRNPYLEKYECCECTKKDTAAINNLIRNNLLTNCETLKLSQNLTRTV
jgi:hypothetical protein